MGGSSGGGGGGGKGFYADPMIYQTQYNPQGQTQYWYGPGTPAPNSLRGQLGILADTQTPQWANVNRNHTFFTGNGYAGGGAGGALAGYNNTPMANLAAYNSPNQYQGAGLWGNDINPALWQPQLSNSPASGDPIWNNSWSGGPEMAGMGNYQPTGGAYSQYMLDTVRNRQPGATFSQQGPGTPNTGIQGSMSNYGDVSGASRWWGANGRPWGT